MAAKLYVVHGSHPCAAVERALELKGDRLQDGRAARRRCTSPIQRLRFGARTVPAIKFDDGEKLSGSRAILRRLEELAPEPPLLPGRRRAARAVEEAERWGDEVLQPIARRLLWPAFARDPRAMPGYQEGAQRRRCPSRSLARSSRR